MTIWIIDKVGYIEGYSLMEQPNQVAVEVEEEPVDFGNWRWTGSELIHDPDNAPVIEEVPNDIEQLKKENEELRQRADIADEAILELADIVLSASTMKGGV